MSPRADKNSFKYEFLEFNIYYLLMILDNLFYINFNKKYISIIYKINKFNLLNINIYGKYFKIF